MHSEEWQRRIRDRVDHVRHDVAAVRGPPVVLAAEQDDPRTGLDPRHPRQPVGLQPTSHHQAPGAPVPLPGADRHRARGLLDAGDLDTELNAPRPPRRSCASPRRPACSPRCRSPRRAAPRTCGSSSFSSMAESSSTSIRLHPTRSSSPAAPPGSSRSPSRRYRHRPRSNRRSRGSRRCDSWIDPHSLPGLDRLRGRDRGDATERGRPARRAVGR